MRHYFLFNKCHSLNDYDVVVVRGPSYKISNEDYEEIEVEGRNGTLTINKGTYPDIVLDFEVKILSKYTENLFDKVENIEEWLTNITDNKLIFDREDRCYLVKKVIFKDISSASRVGGANFNLSFICEPFKYEIDEYLITLTNTSNIHYKGTVPGECNIKIYGTGNIQLTINNETVQINNADGYVELDSKLLLCLNLDKTSKSRDMIGNFLLLIKGINQISWTGNVSKVEILPRTAFR